MIAASYFEELTTDWKQKFLLWPDSRLMVIDLFKAVPCLLPTFLLCHDDESNDRNKLRCNAW